MFKNVNHSKDNSRGVKMIVIKFTFLPFFICFKVLVLLFIKYACIYFVSVFFVFVNRQCTHTKQIDLNDATYSYVGPKIKQMTIKQQSMLV